MRQYKSLVIAFAVFLLVISAGMLVYSRYYTNKVITLPMYFQTSEKIGLNTDTDALYFGKNYPGGTSSREVNITNNNPYDVKVSVKVKGDIAKYTSVSENNFILMPEEKRQIIYYVTTREDTPFMNFTGETKIVITRVLFS